MRKKLTILFLMISITGCMNKKEKLVEKIYALGYPENEIVVSLEDFFEGNNDQESIAPHIFDAERTSPQIFYRKLSELKNLDQVDDVFVRIQDVEDSDWPFTDTVYIISKLSVEEIRSKLTDLHPDEIYEEWMYGQPINAPEVKDGFSIFSVWWD